MRNIPILNGENFTSNRLLKITGDYYGMFETEAYLLQTSSAQCPVRRALQ